MDESQVSRITSKFSLGVAPKGKTYELDGEYLTLPDWAKRYNINYEAVIYRLKRGKTLKDALTLPVRDVSGKTSNERMIATERKKRDKNTNG